MTGVATAPAGLAAHSRAVLAAAQEGGEAAGTTAGEPNVVLAAVLGLLFAVGTYLVLRRDVVRVVWGVSIVSQSANVYLVTMGGITPAGDAPIGGHGGAAGATDPLVQALVLTAIVIGFGTTALALVLTYRVYEEHGTIDTREIGEAGEVDG
jgi:multicomponent Na+:H+ antiporter subunit C